MGRVLAADYCVAKLARLVITTPSNVFARIKSLITVMALPMMPLFIDSWAGSAGMAYDTNTNRGSNKCTSTTSIGAPSINPVR